MHTRYVKIDLSQNTNQSTPLERPYKEQLNAPFSFEIETQVMDS